MNHTETPNIEISSTETPNTDISSIEISSIDAFSTKAVNTDIVSTQVGSAEIETTEIQSLALSDDTAQYQRRFQGTRTLYGQDNFDIFSRAHIIVIGIGGVGSWAVEGLARTGIGKLTLIDMDVLVASNVNRQLPALDSTFGREKIAVMAERAQQINPKIILALVDDFLTADNVTALLPNRTQVKEQSKQGMPTLILDCTDDMSAKLAIALHCRFNKIKLICAGGAGGKTDPLQITVSDLKDAYQDPLLARLRSKLRQDHGINKTMKEKFGIKCVYSTQPPIVSKSADACQTGGLHCGGYGSAVAVTSVVGMVMVNETLAQLKLL